jgi:eukaryotic-like serine/threonine-protein kinase
MVADVLGQVESTLAGRYAIERELGRGGMAVVYLARDLRLGRPVAVKRILPDLASEIAKERFLQEIQIAARLNHPHVLTLHEAGEAADGALFYVMPYVGGESLGRRMERERQLPVGVAVRIARQVASGLQYAHEHNVIHRDIKPENILLTDGPDGAHACIADFGLALALYRAGSERLTTSGISIGTPLYMSPEQAAGGRDAVDARSDIYSLGCVLFEMLAGVAPFHGVSPQQVMTQHMLAPPPPLAQLRPACPPHIAAAVARALAKVPGDRFQSAQEFLDALGRVTPPGIDILPPHGRPRPSAEERRRRKSAKRRAVRRRWLTVGGAASVAAGAGVVLFLGTRTPDGDTMTYAVAPLEYVSAADAGAANRLTDGLVTSLGTWSGVTVVGPAQLGGALTESGVGRRPPDYRAVARAAARRERAGWLVWGAVRRGGDTLYVDVMIEGVGTNAPAMRHPVVIPPGASADGPLWQLASDLVRPGGEAPRRTDRSRRPVLAAWRAVDAGRRAIAAGDTRAADSAFDAALVHDAQLAEASLWSAQLRSWRDGAGSAAAAEWGGRARSAAERAAEMWPRDSIAAEALLALADRQYAKSCDAYRALLRLDSTSFLPRFGIAECQRWNSEVVPDPGSASGFHFRTSLRAAADGYVRSIDYLPSPQLSFPHDRLWELLSVESNRVRFGRLAGADSVHFSAYPALDHDTLSFVPYPVNGGRARTLQPTFAAAVHRKRQMLRRVYERRATQVRDDATTHERLAQILESLGVIGGGDAQSGQSALASIRRARALTRDSLQGLRLAHAEVQLLVKAHSYAAAAGLADSLLGAWRTPGRSAAELLATLAALTGQVQRTTELLGRAGPEGRFGPQSRRGASLPLPSAELADRGAEALTLGALGLCGEKLERFPAYVDTAMAQYYPDSAQRAEVRDALLWRPLSLGFPCLEQRRVLEAVEDGQDLLLPIQRAYGRGEAAVVVARLAALREARKSSRPGDIAIDYTFQEAWLQAAAGDTAGAMDRLDLSLGAPEALSMTLLNNVPQAAGLVRAMALRAELAAARPGGAQTARTYARAVAALRARAGPELAEQMRRIEKLAQ